MGRRIYRTPDSLTSLTVMNTAITPTMRLQKSPIAGSRARVLVAEVVGLLPVKRNFDDPQKPEYLGLAQWRRPYRRQQ
jgi:hypothetical protein